MEYSSEFSEAGEDAGQCNFLGPKLSKNKRNRQASKDWRILKCRMIELDPILFFFLWGHHQSYHSHGGRLYPAHFIVHIDIYNQFVLQIGDTVYATKDYFTLNL